MDIGEASKMNLESLMAMPPLYGKMIAITLIIVND